MIRLTFPNGGGAVYLNPQEIGSIYGVTAGSCVYGRSQVEGLDSHWLVTESPAEVARLVNRQRIAERMMAARLFSDFSFGKPMHEHAARSLDAADALLAAIETEQKP